MKQLLLLLFCLLFFFTKVEGQNTFAALHSNYTPTNSVYINPSSILDAKVWLDINIVGVGAFANNNLVAINDRNTISLIGNEVSDEELIYRQGRNKYQAFARAFIQAPSAVWSQGDHAAALMIRGRSITAAQNVPTFVGPFVEFGVAAYDLQHNIDYSIKNLRSASLNFAEIQGTYAYTFLKKQRQMFMGGISIKKMFSIAGGAGNIEEFNFNVLNDSIARVDLTNADVMYAGDGNFYAKGGLGLDIGFTYQKMLSEATTYKPNSFKGGCRYVPYKYKIGVSINDIGSVKFDPDQIRYVGYNFTDFNDFNYQTTEFDEDQPTDIFINQETDPENGNIKNPERIKLPTHLSVQDDYNLYISKFYLNASIIQGLPHNSKSFGIRHPNSISIAPRYESKWVDFALAFSMYEYQYAQLGTSIRIAYFTVGTDKLIDLLFKNKLYGSDIYVYVKIPFFYHPKCKSKLKKTGNYDPGFIKRRSHKCDAYN